MPLADDLEEKVGSLLAQGKIADLVTDQEIRRLIIVELFQERVVRLCCDEMINHVDGRGEEDFDIGIAGGIGDGFSQEGLSGAGVSDQYDIHVLVDKVQVQEVEDGGFLFFS